MAIDSEFLIECSHVRPFNEQQFGRVARFAALASVADQSEASRPRVWLATCLVLHYDLPKTLMALSKKRKERSDIVPERVRRSDSRAGGSDIDA